MACFHQCRSDCRRDGCNCECGEFHSTTVDEMEYVPVSKPWEILQSQMNVINNALGV